MSLLKAISLGTIIFTLSALSHPSSYNPHQISSCSSNSFNIVNSSDTGIWPYREYKTSPAKPPLFETEGASNSSKLADGFIFLTLANVGLFGYAGVEQQGAVMMSSNGDLVWAGPTGNASNFRRQMLHGKPVITTWLGSGAAASNGGAAHGYGSVEIFNEKYEQIYSVCPQLDILFHGQALDCAADVHESYITPDNTMLVTVYNTTQADLRSVGGPEDGWVLDPLAVEVDIESNQVLWKWDPLDHVPINSSHQPLQGTGQNSSNPYDWFHMNSIQSHGGNFLVNSRQTWTSYYVARNGKVLWQIDGETGGDFGSLPSGANFSWEHDVRIHDHGDNQVLLTMFNDYNGDPLTQHPSVGLGLVLDLPPSKDKSPMIYTHPVDSAHHIFAYAEGSYEVLDNGNVLVGYGLRPVLKEFAAKASESESEVVWSAQFAYVNNNNSAASYRAYKQEWHGTPSAAPRLVVAGVSGNGTDSLSSCGNGSLKRGYVSWNGATDVEAWRIYAEVLNNSMQAVHTVADRGFETEFVVPTAAKFVQVAAVQSGEEMRRSNVVAL